MLLDDPIGPSEWCFIVLTVSMVGGSWHCTFVLPTPFLLFDEGRSFPVSFMRSRGVNSEVHWNACRILGG